MTSMPGAPRRRPRPTPRCCPVEAQTIARAPASAALATATTMPRSLNEPVGFWPSTLRWRFGDADAPRRAAAAWTSGVSPSPRVSDGRRVGDRQERAVALHQPSAGAPAPPGEVSHRSGTGCRSRRHEDVPRGGARPGRRSGRSPAVAGPRSSPAPRAMAIRSPSTADDVAGAARARPVEPDPADRHGVDLDPVADAGRPSRAASRAGAAVGRTAARSDRRRASRAAVASSRMIRPAARASRSSSSVTVGDPGPAGAVGAVGGASGSTPGPASGRRRAGRGSRAC